MSEVGCAQSAVDGAAHPVRELDARASELFIGGRFQPSSGNDTFESIDPAREEVIAILAEATSVDLDRAIERSLVAQPSWSGLPWAGRAEVLRRLADALAEHVERFAEIDVADSGNPIRAMRDDAHAGIRELRYYAGLAGQLEGATHPSSQSSFTFTERSAYGVVGRLTAYNHPFKAAVGKIAAPLAAGNAVILKPSEHCALSALEMARIAERYLPPGTLSVLTGSGSRIGTELVTHPEVERISFTGSVASGRAVLRGSAEHIKHVSVELGGKNPFLVFPDADVPRAARAAVRGMNLARSSGQSCQSTSRIYVHSDVHDEFVTELLAVVQRLRLGDPRDPATDVGPVSFRAHYERVLAAIRSGIDDGATLLCGGGRPDGFERGFYIAPTVFADVQEDMAINTEEIFGPVVSVLKWTNPDEVLAAVNRTRYGLTANIWGRHLSQVLRAARAVQAGYVFVNSEGKRPLGVPFGGWKSSGLGKGSCLDELVSYTREKAITIELA